MLLDGLDGRIHAVQFSLDAPYDHEKLGACLDEQERARRDRLVGQSARRRFEAAHGVTRHLLGSWLGIAGGRIAFTKDQNGKPSLRNARHVRFNLSHSAERAVLAAAYGREVGVDIEQERAIDVLSIARRFLSLTEARSLADTPQDRRRRAFFECWTRKEALLKAMGAGFAFPLDGFDVIGIESAQLVRCGGGQWTLVMLPSMPGFVAALAAEGVDSDVSHWCCSATFELSPFLAV